MPTSTVFMRYIALALMPIASRLTYTVGLATIFLLAIPTMDILLAPEREATTHFGMMCSALTSYFGSRILLSPWAQWIMTCLIYWNLRWLILPREFSAQQVT
jgi:hypothetical protein